MCSSWVVKGLPINSKRSSPRCQSAVSHVFISKLGMFDYFFPYVGCKLLFAAVHTNSLPPLVGFGINVAVTPMIRTTYAGRVAGDGEALGIDMRSEEHTSELQS